MKKMTFYLFFLTIIPLSVSGNFFISNQDTNNFFRVEKPSVDWSSVNPEAFEQGILVVKFKEGFSKHLQLEGLKHDEYGLVKTGIEEFDEVLKRFGVRSGQQALSWLYNIPGRHNQFKERHQQWGFHLWYEFVVDEKSDMAYLTESLKALESVEYAEPRLKIKRIEPVSQKPLTEGQAQGAPKWTPDDPLFGLQWNLENTGQTVSGMPGTPGVDINVKQAWDITKGSTGVVVAVMDGGIKFDHEDLEGNMWPNIGPDGLATDPDDHATSVAGIIAAVSNNDTGIAGIAGGAGDDDGVRLMSLDIFKAGQPPTYLMGLYIYAADNGAAISQNAWSYTDPNSFNTVDLYGIDYFNVHGGGDVMDGGITIFSAGNNGDNQNWYPAYYSGTVAVAGTDNNDFRAYFSSYGDYVELSAPSLNIPSTGIEAGGADDYFYNSGTSFSAPHVSAVGALVLSLAPGKLTSTQVREILKATADNIDHLNPSVAGQIGTGRVNALAALQAIQDLLNGLEYPQSLNTMAVGPTQINLNWTKNANNHNVMVAYTTDNTFGAPANSTVYNPGDNIPGGGVVLYRGSANSLAHTALEPNTVHFYRAYSYSSSNHYSSGRKANGKTQPIASTGVAFHETFEDDSPTRSLWTQIQEVGSSTWTHAAGSTGGGLNTAYQGALNARFVDVSGTNSPITKLVTPVIDILGLVNPVVDFWYGQPKWGNRINELKIYYRANSTAAWVEIAHYAGDASSWTNEVIALPNPSATYQIAFEGINNRGYANVLDEVIIRSQTNSASATYTAGDISTDWPFNPSGVSSCPGSLTVNIPTGAVITGVDVAYSMTAASGAWMSEQRSRLVCTSAGGNYEANIYSGTGDAIGTQAYTRTGLDIANEVTGGGNITFELHALRTWQGGGNCNTTYNRVNNNTWTLTVHYYIPLPSIIYTPLAATTPATGNRNLDNVHISTTHPDGIATGTNAPRIYWRVNGGGWTSAAVSSVSGNLYDFVIGTTGLLVGDQIDYFVIAESVSGDVVAKPGAGLVATDVNTITTYPTNPHSYTIASAPLAGNYNVSASKFSKLAGKEISFERVVNRVVREVWVADEYAAELEKQKTTHNLSREEEGTLAKLPDFASHRANGRFELREVEEITYVPMLNGKVYDGPLYIENTDKSNDIKTTYLTLTAAIADLNSRGVSDEVNFLLTDATYSSGETFPLVINVTSEYKPDAGKPVTIKPATSVTAAITGSVDNDALIRIIDTDYITIDGSNLGGTDRSLTIQNNSSTFPEVILIASAGTIPVVGSGVKNCIITNGSQNSSAIVVVGADDLAGYFNDISILNNSISRAYIGVYAWAEAATGNGSGLLIADNDLDTSGANSIRLVGIYVAGVDGVTMSGNTVSNISNSLAEAIRGIWFAAGTVNGTITGNTVNNLAKSGTSSDQATVTGILITSGTATKNVSVNGNFISNLTNTGALAGFAGILNFAPNVTISGNTISTLTQNTNAATIWGIVTAGASRVEISNNDVSGISTLTIGTPNGINIQGNSTSVKVSSNIISNIKNTNPDGYSSYGLALSSTSTVADILAYNNLLYDVTGYGRSSTTERNGYGIVITGGGGYRLYHNTVHLATSQTAADGIPACLIIASGLEDNSIHLRNNIFSMAAIVGTNRCAVICNSANTVFSTINYNDYHISGGHIGRIGATNRTTLANWQTGTTQDAQSIAVNPNFVSNTNLMPQNAALNVGTPLAGVTDDYASTPRNPLLPTIGAYEMAPGELVWTGGTNNNWHTTTNWNPNRVPTARDNTTIPTSLTNYPTLSSVGTCYNILLESDATSTATLLDNEHLTMHGTATVQRHIPRNGWHFLSSPVSGMDIIGSDFVPDENPLPTNFDFYFFDETVAQVGGNWYPWINVRGAGAIPNTTRFQQFVPGRGYLVAYRAGYVVDNPLEFGGSLHSGEVDIEITNSSTSSAIKGWNLLGNPYPSAINWATADKSQFEDNYAYIYDSTLGGGGGYHPESGIVAPHQGFFVEVKPAAHEEDFTFTNALRLHGGSYLKNETHNGQLVLRLTRQSNSFYDQTTLQLADGSQFERDSQDALKLFSFNAAMPQLFSLTADGFLVSINSIPGMKASQTLDVGLLAPDNGYYQLELLQASGVFGHFAILLQDFQEGNIQDFSTNPVYDFFSTGGTNNSRFKLLFLKPSGIEGIESEGTTIYVWNNILYLNYPDELDDGILSVYDVGGRLVMDRELGQGNNFSLPLDLQPGVYFVSTSNRGQVITKRVFVR